MHPFWKNRSKYKPDHIRDPFTNQKDGDEGWYDHHFFIANDVNNYDPVTRRMRKK